MSVQGDAFATYTTFDVLGATSTYAYGIDGSNVVGYYYAGGYHGFKYDGSSYTALDMEEVRGSSHLWPTRHQP